MIVNIITQILLNVSVNLFYDNFGGQFGTVVLFIFLEFIIFIVEAFKYTSYMWIKKEYKIPLWKPVVYALVANSVSFVLGLILAFFVPGLF